MCKTRVSHSVVCVGVPYTTFDCSCTETVCKVSDLTKIDVVRVPLSPPLLYLSALEGISKSCNKLDISSSDTTGNGC